MNALANATIGQIQISVSDVDRAVVALIEEREA